MAFCPRCAGQMEMAQAACPHCGYDFPAPATSPAGAFNPPPLVDLAFLVGILGAGLGCLFAAVAGLAALVSGQFLTALVFGPMLFSLFLAVLVVLVKAQPGSRRDRPT